MARHGQPNFGGYLDEMKNHQARNRTWTMYKNAIIRNTKERNRKWKEENREVQKQRQQEKLLEGINKLPKSVTEYRDQQANRREMIRQKATMTEAEREEYGVPKIPERSPMARSEKEAERAYREKTEPGYKEYRARYDRYMRRKKAEDEYLKKNEHKLIIAEGNGPRAQAAKNYRRVTFANTK